MFVIRSSEKDYSWNNIKFFELTTTLLCFIITFTMTVFDTSALDKILENASGSAGSGALPSAQPSESALPASLSSDALSVGGDLFAVNLGGVGHCFWFSYFAS